MPRVAFRNFTGGEVSPSLGVRYDLQKFGTFAQCMLNFLPNIHGDVERRPGTRFLADLGGECVLLPFQYNSEAGKNFVLAFSAGSIRVFDADGDLKATMASPYAVADVPGLSIKQVGKYIYVANRKYALRKISWDGASGWTISEVQLNKSIAAPGKPNVYWERGTKNDESDELYTKHETYTLSYKITAVDADGVESIASEVGEVDGRYPTDWVQGDHVSITWDKVQGAEEYNIYRDSAGYYGFIGTASKDDLAKEKSGIEYVTVNSSRFLVSTALSYNVETRTNGPDDGTVTTTGYSLRSSGATYTSFFSQEMNQRFVYGSEGWILFSGSNTTGTWSTGEVTKGAWAHNGGKWPSGASGSIVVVPVYRSTTTGMLQFNDENFEPDTARTPKEDWNPFEDGNHPSSVALHHQRLVLAGTKDDPATVFMSRTGDYENFRKSFPLQDDDPVEYMIASGSIDDIQWIDSFGDLLIGTSGAEFKMSASGAAITPSDCQISTQSYWGSSGVQPLIIGNSVIHCQRADSHIRDLYYSWENDGYAGNDLSLLAPQLLETHKVRQMVFQQSPGSNIWIVRDDGVLLALTYMQEQKVYGWSRHITEGKVRSVCAICGDREDVLLMVVERRINGVAKFYLERLVERFKDSDPIENAWYVDCGCVRTPEADPDGRNTIVTGLGHVEGRTVAVLADGSPEEHVVKDGRITLDFPCTRAIVGLNYHSVLSPLPVESDSDNGSTLGKRRTYGKVVLRLYRSVGGKWAGTGSGDLFDVDGWRQRTLYDIPFLPEVWGEAVPPFSGDVEITMGHESHMDNDSSVWIVQDRPLPFRLVALMCDVDFGEM